jgi:hypothetical protein
VLGPVRLGVALGSDELGADRLGAAGGGEDRLGAERLGAAGFASFELWGFGSEGILGGVRLGALMPGLSSLGLMLPLGSGAVGSLESEGVISLGAVGSGERLGAEDGSVEDSGLADSSRG